MLTKDLKELRAEREREPPKRTRSPLPTPITEHHASTTTTMKKNLEKAHRLSYHDRDRKPKP
jgi:hypothetical protein